MSARENPKENIEISVLKRTLQSHRLQGLFYSLLIKTFSYSILIVKIPTMIFIEKSTSSPEMDILFQRPQPTAPRRIDDRSRLFHHSE